MYMALPAEATPAHRLLAQARDEIEVDQHVEGVDDQARADEQRHPDQMPPDRPLSQVPHPPSRNDPHTGLMVNRRQERALTVSSVP
jgi:hypothetical protein